MFEIVALILIFSIFIAIIISLSLMIFRIYLVIKDKRPLKEALLIILMPGGTGYYLFYKENTRQKTWYQRSVLIMFIFAFIGSIYIAFLNIPAFASWFFYGI